MPPSMMPKMLTLEEAKAWYCSQDPVHGFQHILRVYTLARRLAQAEGADEEIVLTAALLHDAEGPGVGDARMEHQHASALFAAQVLREKNWDPQRIEAVQHCIRAHRFRDLSEQPQTIEAKVIFDADKLDAIGAVGAARAIAYAVLAQQELYASPSEQFIQTGEKLPGEPHTPYHEFLFKLQNLKDRMYTQSGRALAQARHHYLEGFFIQLQAELNGER